MKKQFNLSGSLATVALVTVAILLIPFTAMQFTSEVNWTLTDFLIMGALIFSTGLSYVLVNRLAPNWVYRIALILTIGGTFLMIWANLAVGLIGEGPNMGNIMYGIVALIVIAGAIISRFKAGGMERVMYTAAFSVVALTTTVIANGTYSHSGSSFAEVTGMGAFFVALFLFASWLFRSSRYS